MQTVSSTRFSSDDLAEIRERLATLGQVVDGVRDRFDGSELIVEGLVDEALVFTHPRSALAFVDGFLSGFDAGFGAGRSV